MPHLVLRLRTFAHIAALTLLPVVTACTGTYTHAYERVQVNLPFVGSQSVALAVIDRRRAVTTGERNPKFVGTYRRDSAHASPVSTASGEPFAKDVSTVVANALKRSGYPVQTIAVAPGTSEAKAFAELAKTGASHLVVLVIRKWSGETFRNTALTYDLALVVQNPEGALLGQSSLKGSDQLAPDVDDPSAAAEQALVSALEHKLNLLFAEPQVRAAFERKL